MTVGSDTVYRAAHGWRLQELLTVHARSSRSTAQAAGRSYSFNPLAVITCAELLKLIAALAVWCVARGGLRALAAAIPSQGRSPVTCSE